MQLNLKLSQKGLILVAVPLFFELLFVAALTFLLNRADYEIWKEAHSRAVVSQSNNLLQHLVDASTNFYLYKTTRQPIFGNKFEAVASQFPEEIRSLKRLLYDDPERQKSVERVERVANRTIALLSGAKLVVEGKASETGPELDNLKRELMGSMKLITEELHRFVNEEKARQKQNPDAEANARWLVVWCIVAGVVLNVLIAVGLAVFFNTGTASRLRVLMENTQNLARGESLRERILGTDELAHLDHVFHDMADALAEAARHKQDLIAMVSHDLRSPLSSVQGSLTMLLAGVFGALTERAAKEVTIAEHNTGRLINMINDLLDIERMEAGKLEMHCINAKIDDVFDQAEETIGPFCTQHGIKLAVVHSGLDVYADPDRLIQVLVNLISNAVKFSPKESTITLSANKQESWVEVRVTDQGRGIPPEYRESIFQRFKQVKKEDAQTGKGTGLGLAICKAIVDGHNGEIGVDSELGKGSSFWFRIPAARQA